MVLVPAFRAAAVPTVPAPTMMTALPVAESAPTVDFAMALGLPWLSMSMVISVVAVAFICVGVGLYLDSANQVGLIRGAIWGGFGLLIVVLRALFGPKKKKYVQLRIGAPTYVNPQGSAPRYTKRTAGWSTGGIVVLALSIWIGHRLLRAYVRANDRARSGLLDGLAPLLGIIIVIALLIGVPLLATIICRRLGTFRVFSTLYLLGSFIIIPAGVATDLIAWRPSRAYAVQEANATEPATSTESSPASPTATPTTYRVARASPPNPTTRAAPRPAVDKPTSSGERLSSRTLNPTASKLTPNLPTPGLRASPTGTAGPRFSQRQSIIDQYGIHTTVTIIANDTLGNLRSRLRLRDDLRKVPEYRTVQSTMEDGRWVLVVAPARELSEVAAKIEVGKVTNIDEATRTISVRFDR